MTQIELQFYIIITYFSYLLLLCVFHSKMRRLAFLAAFVFFWISLLLRLNVPIEKNADYGGYISFMYVEYEFKLKSILSEPYFPMLLNFVYKFTNNWNSAMYGVYIINFLLSSIFYIWFAFRSNIKFWIKILFFSFSYILLTYTVLRNAPAYFLFGYLIYYLLENKKFPFGYLGFLTHVSALPALAATFLGFKKPNYKQFIFIFLGAALFSIVLSLPYFSHISGKLDAYTSVDIAEKFGVSIFHKLYLVGILGLSFLIYKHDKTIIYNNFYCSVFLIYIILHILNPVMAYRFSYYLIIYFVMIPFYKQVKIDKVLNVGLGILLIFLFYNSFYSSHLDLLLLQ